MKKYLAALAILAIGCGGEVRSTPAATASVVAKPITPAAPNLAQAKEIIEQSPDLGDFLFTHAAITIPTKKSAMNGDARGNAKALVEGGFIRFEGDAVLLADKGKSDPRLLLRPNGFIDVVPVVKKSMGNVTAVRSTTEGVDCDFTWRWVPTEIGQLFKSGPVRAMTTDEQRSTATLIWDGARWSVLRIREAG